MGLFGNRETFERKSTEYNELIEQHKNCLKKYECLIQEHEEQTKEYTNCLHRFENQLEIHAEDIKEYDMVLKKYGIEIADQEEKLIQYESIADDSKRLITEMSEKIMLKSLENKNQMIEKIEESLASTEKHNQSLRKSVAFLLFFNLVTLVMIIVSIFI